jgi:hypothetical protein
MMEQEPPTRDITYVSMTTALAADEDAWYRHEANPEEIAIHEWVRQRTLIRSVSGNALADEEDAWARY